MKKIISLSIYRGVMLKNFMIYHLRKTPSFISFLFLLPLFLYFAGELAISDELKIYSLNPDLMELAAGYNVFFFRLLYFIVVFIGPVYIFLSRLHIKSYKKYRSFNITFKTVSNANIYLFLFFIDLLLLILFSFVLFHTSSTVPSMLIFFCLLLPSMDLSILILYYFYQISIALLEKMLKSINAAVIEVMFIILFTFALVFVLTNLSLGFAMSIPCYLTFINLIALFLILKFFYERLPLKNIMRSNQKKREERRIQTGASMNILKNYLWMLYDSRGIYLEFGGSFLIFLAVVMHSELRSYKELIFQMLVICSIISSGVIYSYKKWYFLHPKKVLQKLLAMDFAFFLAVTFVISLLLSLIICSNIQLTYVFLTCCTYIIVSIIQKYLKLEYVNDSKSPILFVLIYGSLSFACFALLQNGYAFCIGYLMR